ncbi:hypothetical protein WJX72_008666 [[Myrmecia] bisecta]|uniref:Cilia- and flagella-associated protein 58 central coiled coil domain-containing protein n=1 Tax=[Myrmecia] bisecta TaxID=41462 RepID=A0AAW1R996_9CHLO
MEAPNQLEDFELLLDVSNSTAFQALAALVKSGDVGLEHAEAARQQYARIHEHLVRVMANEKALLDQAKALKRQLEEEESQAQEASEASIADQAGVIRKLREEAEAARAEVAVSQEGEAMRQLELSELQRQRSEIRARLEELEAQHQATLAPQRDALQSEVTALVAEARAGREREAAAQAELAALRERLDQLSQQAGGLAEARANEAVALEKAGVGPEKARRAADLLTNAVKSLRVQDSQTLGRLQERESQLTGYQAKVAQLEESQRSMQAAIEKGRIACEAKARAADDIIKDLEIARLEAENYAAERVSLEMEEEVRAGDVKREREVMTRKNLERDKALRKLKKAEAMLHYAQEQVPPLRASQEAAACELTVVQRQLGQAEAATTELKKDTDILINSFLKEEHKGEAHAALFKAGYAEIQALEAEVAALRREEAERLIVQRDLATQRDRIGRTAAEKTRALKETLETIALKQIVLQDLKRARKDTMSRVQDFQQLYDLVKNQRNKFVSLVGVASQSIAELKDKLKILGNELAILHNEEGEKEVLLQRARTGHTASQSDRDTLRQDLNKLIVQFRKRQDAVDEQISEIDKLNAVINGAEREMLRLRKEYEGAVEGRNYTGIMLIDRNDELCILYEKANIQEEVMRKGQIMLQRREDEIRMLKLEVAEMSRALGVVRALLPVIPGLDTDIALLQKQLLETRRQADQLSLQLESPANKSRWRRLEGKVADAEELAAKVAQLEERLNDKREVLLEKELILEEITSLSARLRSQAAEGRQDTLELAKRVNEYQSRLRALTRCMMATVSELSLYQATSLKLGAEKEKLDMDVVQAHQRLEAGEAPTADAEREWQRLQREQQMLADMREQAEEIYRIQEKQITSAPSQAEPRPNAYIPEDLGIPKPYGGFAPFKPSEPGSGMRHIRQPEPREIII